MKKVFMEPELRRIELNLKENIATSLGYGQYATFKTMQEGNECTQFFVDTGIHTSLYDIGELTSNQLFQMYTHCRAVVSTFDSPEEAVAQYRAMFS